MSFAEVRLIAPGGIGEVTEGCDLAALIVAACTGEATIADGDIVVVTSKVVSKAEGRYAPLADKEAALRRETRQVVARRGGITIVESRLGLIHAAAGIDGSNVDSDQILLLPLAPDDSAARLRAAIGAATGARIGVIISDTAGRAWRTGQTDLALGLAGVRPLESYAGRNDRYGNELRVTEMAVADELAAAADLVKGKLAGRPVALVRGLAHLVDDPEGNSPSHDDAPAHDSTAGPRSAAGYGGAAGQGSAALLRPPEQDLFRRGRREAILEAVLRTTGQVARYDEVVGLDADALVRAVAAGAPEPDRPWVERLLTENC